MTSSKVSGSGSRARVAFSTDAALCRYQSCDDPAITAGWCHAHYQRRLLGKPMDPPVRHRRHEIPAVRLLPRITG